MDEMIRSQAEAYRRQAEQLRAVADTFTGEAQETFHKLAIVHDGFAESLERMATRCRYDAAPWQFPSLTDRPSVRQG
jgi:hypothetical protein